MFTVIHHAAVPNNFDTEMNGSQCHLKSWNIYTENDEQYLLNDWQNCKVCLIYSKQRRNMQHHCHDSLVTSRLTCYLCEFSFMGKFVEPLDRFTPRGCLSCSVLIFNREATLLSFIVECQEFEMLRVAAKRVPCFRQVLVSLIATTGAMLSFPHSELVGIRRGLKCGPL